MPKVPTSKVAISSEYRKKETVRQQLQDLIENSISRGEVTNQGELEELLKTLQMSLEALKMVPFAVYQKTSTRIK